MGEEAVRNVETACGEDDGGEMLRGWMVKVLVVCIVPAVVVAVEAGRLAVARTCVDAVVDLDGVCLGVGLVLVLVVVWEICGIGE